MLKLSVKKLFESLAGTKSILITCSQRNHRTNLKILEAAYKWKKQKIAASEDCD